MLIANALVEPTGVSATVSQGAEEEVVAAAVVIETGFLLNAYLGDEGPTTGDAVVLPTGVSAIGRVTRPTVWGSLSPSYTDIWTEIKAA